MRKQAKRRLVKAFQVIARIATFGLVTFGKTEKTKRAAEVIDEAASFGDGGVDEEGK